MHPSEKAITFITDQETGGEAYYNSRERTPTWPGGVSGVTIGDGYDCGYETVAEIKQDWSPYLSNDAVSALCRVSGIHGRPARSVAAEIKHLVTVPWEAAIAVFRNRDIPKWGAILDSQLSNLAMLSGDSYGALLSLTFNRGASFHDIGDRYLEMRNIVALMRGRHFADIPAEIRKMKRLWPLDTPEHEDLRKRRDAEAALFEEGLKA